MHTHTHTLTCAHSRMVHKLKMHWNEAQAQSLCVCHRRLTSYWICSQPKYYNVIKLIFFSLGVLYVMRARSYPTHTVILQQHSNAISHMQIRSEWKWTSEKVFSIRIDYLLVRLAWIPFSWVHYRTHFTICIHITCMHEKSLLWNITNILQLHWTYRPHARLTMYQIKAFSNGFRLTQNNLKTTTVHPLCVWVCGIPHRHNIYYNMNSILFLRAQFMLFFHVLTWTHLRWRHFTKIQANRK